MPLRLLFVAMPVVTGSCLFGLVCGNSSSFHIECSPEETLHELSIGTTDFSGENILGRDIEDFGDLRERAREFAANVDVRERAREFAANVDVRERAREFAANADGSKFAAFVDFDAGRVRPSVHGLTSLTHHKGTDVHSETTDTHKENTDVHLSSTDEHFANTDVHLTSSDTHKTNTDVHLSSSDTHKTNTDVHLKTSVLHPVSTRTIRTNTTGVASK